MRKASVTYSKKVGYAEEMAVLHMCGDSALGLGGCEDNSRKVKIGVSIGAGGAARWQKDMAFMQERAKALGADIELRLNLPDSSKTQAEDCLEMLSDGIDVLIITPNNTRKVDDVLMYAKQKNTKVVSYARAVMGATSTFRRVRLL